MPDASNAPRTAVCTAALILYCDHASDSLATSATRPLGQTAAPILLARSHAPSQHMQLALKLCSYADQWLRVSGACWRCRRGKCMLHAALSA